MKKKTLLLLALVAIPAFGQLKPKVAISYELQPSYVFVQSQKITTTSPGVVATTIGDAMIKYEQPPIIIKYGLEYQYKRASVYFDNTVYCGLKGSPLPGNFSPQQVSFNIGVKYQITKNIKFSYEHMCTHTVCVQSNETPITRMNGSYDKFSLSYGY